MLLRDQNDTGMREHDESLFLEADVAVQTRAQRDLLSRLEAHADGMLGRADGRAR